MDNLTTDKRSNNMSRIRSKDTKPEKIVRSILFSLGFRFRLHGKVSKKVIASGYLPGRPDVVLAGRKTVIFVNGCFWHQHHGCKRATFPKSNTEYWIEKFQKNEIRDIENRRAIQELGWNVIIIWECETKAPEKLRNTLRDKILLRD